MASINDTTPRMEHLGTKDEGGRQVYPQPKTEKLWQPKVLAFSEKGDSSQPFEVTGDEFNVIFGKKTLDPRSKFFNHQLYMANKVFKAGGSIVFQKLDVPALEIPGKTVDGVVVPATSTKVSKAAGITLYAMVSDVDVKNYKRTSAGKIIKPLEEDGTVTGHEVAFIATEKNTAADIVKEGTLNGEATTIYPLFSIESIGQNAIYNKLALTIDAQTGSSNDEKILDELKAFQVGLGIISKETGVVKKVKNILGLGEVFCTFKEFSVDPLTNTAISVDDVFPKKWSNVTNINLPLTSAPFKDIEVHDGLAAFTAKLAKSEATAITDKTAETLYAMGNSEWEVADKATAFNWVSFKDPANENEYFSSVLSPATYDIKMPASLAALKPKRVDISDKTPIYLRGGEDGDVANLAVYEKAVLASLADYEDRDNRVQSIPLNTENVFVDTGFSLNTSLKLPMIQSHRADIELILATYVFDKKDKSGENVERDISSAALLRNAVSLTPESKEYNTPTSRATIVQGSGKDRDEIYPYLLPNTIELAYQSALYMGGSSWNGKYKFGGQPGSLFMALTDIRPAELPFSVRSKLHNTGVMYAEVEDRGNWFFSSYKGVYTDGTSPLASYHTNIALTYFVKLHHRMWRKYTGRADLSEGELKTLIESDMRDSLGLDKFNNEFKALIPEVYFLEFDTLKGHIWRQRIYTYRENERMVMISDNVVRRASDLEGGN